MFYQKNHILPKKDQSTNEIKVHHCFLVRITFKYPIFEALKVEQIKCLLFHADELDIFHLIIGSLYNWKI